LGEYYFANTGIVILHVRFAITLPQHQTSDSCFCYFRRT